MIEAMDCLATHVHQTSIRIQIRVDLNAGDGQASCLQKQATAACNDALPHAGDNTCKSEPGGWKNWKEID